jgi:hypothetical protein
MTLAPETGESIEFRNAKAGASPSVHHRTKIALSAGKSLPQLFRQPCTSTDALAQIGDSEAVRNLPRPEFGNT